MPMKLYFFQLNKRVSGKNQPRVSICCASFPSKAKAKKWAEKMQNQARDGQVGPLSTFRVKKPSWKRPKNIIAPRIKNTGQAKIADIFAIRSIQYARWMISLIYENLSRCLRAPGIFLLYAIIWLYCISYIKSHIRKQKKKEAENDTWAVLSISSKHSHYRDDSPSTHPFLYETRRVWRYGKCYEMGKIKVSPNRQILKCNDTKGSKKS